MKRSLTFPILLIICSLLMTICGTSTGLSQFEGIIESRNTTTDEHGKPQQFMMTMYIRHDMVKIQNSPTSSSPGSVMIYRGDKKALWMVSEEDKSYFEVRQDERPEELYSPSASDATQPVVRKTGRKRQVLGYNCEQLMVRADNLETELWATKSLGQVYSTISKVLGSESTAQGESWENTIMKMGYYPLIATTRVDGKILESQEVTRIEKKLLAQEMFELPPGYKKQSAGE